jgi:hypothetical protein
MKLNDIARHKKKSLKQEVKDLKRLKKDVPAEEAEGRGDGRGDDAIRGINDPVV